MCIFSCFSFFYFNINTVQLHINESSSQVHKFVPQLKDPEMYYPEPNQTCLSFGSWDLVQCRNATPRPGWETYRFTSGYY